MDCAEKVNILLVDDQPGKLLAHEVILMDLGENVIRASSGREALEYLLKMDFAVILLDVNMPDMDGFETAALIRQRPRLERTPIIFITAYNTSDLDKLKGYGMGGVDYLFVPVVPEVLKAKVQVFVDLFRQKQIIRKQAEDLALHNREQTEQIRLIQELNGKLKAANDELEAFSYSISHDLRSPLRAMHGYAQALLEDVRGKLGAEGEEYLSRIQKAALRMDSLIQDILAYSRVSKTEIQTRTIDLETLISEIIQQYRVFQEPLARVVIERPLPKVEGHEGCLTQCISNLLGNAVKFVPPGTVPEVKICGQILDSRVRLWIQDNGIGIDPSHYDRIFKMFGRVHSDKLYEGTGIGLTIVKKAIEKMGGGVGVDSMPGKGSRFWIELPHRQV
jgi:signal transduction histidine kinase